MSGLDKANEIEDDRFIAKELSRPELQTMETFAPAYFDYMSSAISANVSVQLVRTGTNSHPLSVQPFIPNSSDVPS